MVVKIGYNSYVGFDEEVTFGTAIAPAKYIEYNSEGFEKTIDEKLIEAINGGRQFTKRVTTNENVAGSLEFPVNSENLLKIFKHLCGAMPTTTVPAGETGNSVYQHEFLFDTLSTNTSFTFQVCRDTVDTTTSYNYTGCKVNTVNFANTVGDILNCSLDIMGKQQANADTISTASHPSSNPFVFKDGTIKIGDSKTAATATAKVSDVTINIENGLIENRSIGDATRDAIEPGMQNITWDISATFESTSLTNRFLNSTKSYVSAEWVGDSISASSNHKITFESYNSYFNGEVPKVGGANEILSGTFPIRAIKEDSSVGSLVVTIINNVASIGA